MKTNVTGSSRGFSLLGFITVVSPNYIKAVQHLYKEAGITEGRALAIANIAQQDTSPYFILFSLPKITLRADVIEFTGPPPSGSPAARGSTTALTRRAAQAALFHVPPS